MASKPRLLSTPPRLPLIAPSILSADFANMGRDCAQVLDVGADLLHLDVMDGHFVPNLTMGPALCASLRGALPGAFLDVHLMVTDPGHYVEAFAKAGANHLTFHVEVVAAEKVADLIKRIRGAGLSVGLALNPMTHIDCLLPHIHLPDLVLVMSVNPGYSGQAFIESTLEKSRTIKPLFRPDQRLEMDGGIAPDNAVRVREAGCDVLVAASAIFGKPIAQRGDVIATLRG